MIVEARLIVELFAIYLHIFNTGGVSSTDGPKRAWGIGIASLL